MEPFEFEIVQTTRVAKQTMLHVGLDTSPIITCHWSSDASVGYEKLFCHVVDGEACHQSQQFASFFSN